MKTSLSALTTRITASFIVAWRLWKPLAIQVLEDAKSAAVTILQMTFGILGQTETRWPIEDASKRPTDLLDSDEEVMDERRSPKIQKHQRECTHMWGKWNVRPVTEGGVKKVLWQRMCMSCALMETVTRHETK